MASADRTLVGIFGMDPAVSYRAPQRAILIQQEAFAGLRLFRYPPDRHNPPWREDNLLSVLLFLQATESRSRADVPTHCPNLCDNKI